MPGIFCMLDFEGVCYKTNNNNFIQLVTRILNYKYNLGWLEKVVEQLNSQKYLHAQLSISENQYWQLDEIMSVITDKSVVHCLE